MVSLGLKIATTPVEFWAEKGIRPFPEQYTDMHKERVANRFYAEYCQRCKVGNRWVYLKWTLFSVLVGFLTLMLIGSVWAGLTCIIIMVSALGLSDTIRVHPMAKRRFCQWVTLDILHYQSRVDGGYEQSLEALQMPPEIAYFIRETQREFPGLAGRVEYLGVDPLVLFHIPGKGWLCPAMWDGKTVMIGYRGEEQ